MLHLIQGFKFETDSLEDFSKMLDPIVHIMFRSQNSQYTKLHLRGKPSYGWNDGSEYKWSNKGILEQNGRHLTIEPCATFAGATEYKVSNSYSYKEDAAKEVSHCDKLPPTRLWVATLADSIHDFNAKNDDVYCAGQTQMINKAMQAMALAERNKKEEFDALRVEDWMEDGDGSVNTGFRMHMDYDGGSEVLILSLCHIYYGK